MAVNLVNVLGPNAARQEQRKALVLANQIRGGNQSQRLKRAYRYVRRYPQSELIRFRRVNGRVNQRVVFEGMPPGYVFKTDRRIENEGRTPWRDRAKKLSGMSEKDSIISSYDNRTVVLG